MTSRKGSPCGRQVTSDCQASLPELQLMQLVHFFGWRVMLIKAWQAALTYHQGQQLLRSDQCSGLIPAHPACGDHRPQCCGPPPRDPQS